jgi:hypothetical protein
MTTPTTFKGLVGELIGLINIIIPGIFALIFLVLVWKIFDAWVINGADESKREEGKKYAVAATFVLVLLLISWGLVSMIRAAFFG